ncbi:4-aminobutyrate--2-oxoglutarate transaminase [Sulfobacillus thermosulfidooxidans]|uniref:4-aminobutyrate--2-oxoglutarate transaminase n=1 Tax=Sulfobacillus thermosulfidooxidans TaxID=28034 RepID=UPI00096BBE76|nr:4-aminobutyrate--2-oxoglutarate transaminase [Sulfobacillus thermosulfidooxidans]OLZ09621.1 4-aminobutyrate transaminase [Sulfobacillus thermosulfidooxidans]OLZ16073.1 4-aminobutyrate transaminase [Sulfobacillus thermosulfidooxidans]OLZ18079.1 4-aminobutyrate transaminase [Sulfobacillus thermosulfidooxidans]
MATATKYIELKTEIPGPRSQSVLARIDKATPRATSVYAPLVIDKAHGSLLTDIDGNTFIDLTGGVGVLNVGHTHDKVRQALHEQVDRFLHTDFTVVPYESYVLLAERLNAKFPGGGPATTVFFNSGAEAVENAIKIARAYTKRKGIIAFERAFHGRTLMAMTLTSKVHPYKAGMGPFAPEVYRVPFPYPYRCPYAQGSSQHECDETCYQAIEQALMLQVAPEDVAAVIVEPVQGEGGFVVPPKSFLPWLRAFTERHGILLIVDEVQTGFGRTGKFFATEYANIRPDLLTMAKSIADGVPLSGVMGRAEVMDGPGDSQIGGTYVGNPLATAAGNAVLDIFEEEDLLSQAEKQGEYLMTRLGAMQKKYPVIGDVRGLGAMVAIELVKDPQTKEPYSDLTARILNYALHHGVIMLKAGIYGNVIRFLAPLNTPLDMLEEALNILEKAFEEEGQH